MKLFINRNQDANSSSVVSLTENNTKILPSLFLGDVQEIEIAGTLGILERFRRALGLSFLWRIPH